MDRDSDAPRISRNRAQADLAFEVYVRLGPQRSLLRAMLELRRHGVRVSERTIQRWSARHGWSRRLAAIEDAAGAALDQRLVDDRVARLLDQAALGRALQQKALEVLAATPPELMKPELAVKLAVEGSALERATLDAAADAQDRAFRERPDELRRRLREIDLLMANVDASVERLPPR